MYMYMLNLSCTCTVCTIPLHLVFPMCTCVHVLCMYYKRTSSFNLSHISCTAAFCSCIVLVTALTCLITLS